MLLPLLIGDVALLGKRILVLRAFRHMWKPLVDASQLDRQGRWMSTTQGGKPCFMFSQGDAAPAF